MTASFTRDSQVCEAIIEPERVRELGIDHGHIPAEVAEEIVNEIAPVVQRGKRISGLIFGNYTSWVRNEYEHVSIMTLLIGRSGPQEDMKVDEVRIRWKQRQCY